MTSSESNKQALRPPHEVFTPEELRNLASRMQASGELGRSKVYIALLDYLIKCSASDKSPKEFEIAFDALGKGPDFDVSKDSTVRVYVHQLRKNSIATINLTTQMPSIVLLFLRANMPFQPFPTDRLYWRGA